MWNIARAAAKPVKRRIAVRMNRRSGPLLNIAEMLPMWR
jgi:hypothetical protein